MYNFEGAGLGRILGCLNMERVGIKVLGKFLECLSSGKIYLPLSR